MSDFWARRKQAVAAETRAEEMAEEQAVHAAAEAELAERSDEDLLHEAGLPDPDQLTSAEEVQNFLKAELPQRLKTRALRKLWRLNPVLANLDGLVDYGEDFTDAATVIPDLQTVYKVGQGMIAKLEELGTAEKEEASASPDEVAPLEATPEPTAEERSRDEVPVPELSPPSPIPTPDFPPEPQVATATRRMQFRFDTTEQGQLT